MPLLLAIAAARPLPAVEIPAELSWADCVRTAIANNPALKAKRLATEQYKYLYQAGFNSYLPSVGISHTLSRSGSQLAPPSSRVSTVLSASEPLFNLKSASSIRSAKINYDRAYADYRAASAAARQRLNSAFVNLVYAQENAATRKKILLIRQNNAQLVKLEYDSGTESRGNMLYAAALADLSRSQVVQAERSLDSARADLLNSMGISGYRPIVASAALTAPDYAFDAGKVKSVIDGIPQVVLQQKNLELLEERRLSAGYDLYPTLTASQSLGWSGGREFAGGRSWSLGLSLNLPLFSNGPTYYVNSAKAADLALKSAKASLQDLKNSLENDILKGHNDFQNAKDAALANVGMLSAGEERYREAQIKYQAGKMSFIDLETIEQNLVDAQLNQLSYFRNAVMGGIYLESLLGTGLENP